MAGVRITPEQGKLYSNKGGGKFFCLNNIGWDAIMINVSSYWCFKAHGVVQYEDGSIEWDCSTEGHRIDDLRDTVFARECIAVHMSYMERWEDGEAERAWINNEGLFCIAYESGRWWHYTKNENDIEWW